MKSKEQSAEPITMPSPERPLSYSSQNAPLVQAAFSSFPSGLVAVCAKLGEERVGMIASSFSVGVSFKPPLVILSVQNSSTTWPRLRESEKIGVSVLGETHTKAVYQLASRNGDRFAGLHTSWTYGGAILLHGASVWMECSIMSETPAGDHTIVLLEVDRADVDPEIAPLVYHDRKVHTLSTLGRSD